MSNRTKAKNCGNCEHYDSESVPVMLFRKSFQPCRGSTPLIEVGGQFGPRGVFPLMPADGWCGQFKALDRTAVAVRVGTPTVEG